jgi:hypothetical protein
MRASSLALLAYLALPGAAAAAGATDADVLKRFGMLGRLAVDCTAPYSETNPYLIYDVSQKGRVTRILKSPTLDAALPLRNVRMLTSDLVQFQESGRASELTISIIKIDGKFRNWTSTQADGVALITDGRFTDSGKPTAAFTFCGN